MAWPAMLIVGAIQGHEHTHSDTDKMLLLFNGVTIGVCGFEQCAPDESAQFAEEVLREKERTLILILIRVLTPTLTQP